MISYTISYVRRTYCMSKFRFLPVVRATSYTMSYTTSYIFYTTSYVQHTISPKNVRHHRFFTSSCQSYVQHSIRHRTFIDYVAYDVQHRYYTISYVRFRCRWLTSPYDIALRRRTTVVGNIVVYDMPYVAYNMLAWGGSRRGRTYWPCPSNSHRSCSLILDPAGWPILHQHRVDPLSLSLAGSGTLRCCQ